MCEMSWYELARNKFKTIIKYIFNTWKYLSVKFKANFIIHINQMRTHEKCLSLFLIDFKLDKQYEVG